MSKIWGILVIFCFIKESASLDACVIDHYALRFSDVSDLFKLNMSLTDVTQIIDQGDGPIQINEFGQFSATPWSKNSIEFCGEI
ncbi:unnamed protein product [Caenorhabditis angaria]|uniref:Receptor L-domain domain-containing protein n=1 Tax=Caenorhabditis angaria TaxID=860376 RepID=A0A9P1ITF3_9PELO|nr:unnamed protein product [Caenorhabditis angaria]